MWNHIQYVGQHIHYTCDITATNLCHHTHCIDNIIPILCMTSHSAYVWHLWTIDDITSSLYDIKPPFLWHHIHSIWHRIHCICVITSTVLLISHQLYLWDLIRYIWWHDIHCIWHHIHYICIITATVSSSSHPLFWWYHTLCSEEGLVIRAQRKDLWLPPTRMSIWNHVQMMSFYSKAGDLCEVLHLFSYLLFLVINLRLVRAASCFLLLEWEAVR